jgi:hypothetical protein
MSEPCIHETDIELLKSGMPRLEGKVDALIVMLQGNGDQPGLKTRIILNSTAIKMLSWLAAVQLAAIIGGTIKIFFF